MNAPCEWLAVLAKAVLLHYDETNVFGYVRV